MGDFAVSTNGNCFLCMDKVLSQTAAVKLEPESRQATASVHSLQYLSRYLKMDMRRVFDEEDVVPPELLAKVEKAKLKVELCESCASLNKSFSKLYRQLEKVEMEMVSHVTLLHKLVAGERKETPNGSNIGNAAGTLKITKVLRDEAKQKCLRKLKATPGLNIKMQNWSMKQLHIKIQKIKTIYYNQRQKKEKSTFSYQTKNCENVAILKASVKEEFVEEDSLEVDDDNSQNDNFDDCDYDYDDEQNEVVGRLHSPSQSAPTPTASNPDFVEQQETEKEAERFLAGSSSPPSPPKYGMEAGSYKCKLCSKVFTKKCNWSAHYKEAHLKIRFKCTLCGMEFGKRSNHKRHHQNVHMGVKFKCLVCNKTFTLKQNLVQHQKKRSCKAGKPLKPHETR